VGKLNLKKQGGFTVVELLIVLIVLTIVLSLGYMFFSFGLRAFSRGEQQSIAQQGIRNAANFISSEIRYAEEIIINPEEIVDNDQYYYIYQQVGGGSVIYRDTNMNERILLDHTFDEIAYSISFAEQSFTAGIDTSLVVSFVLEAENDLYVLDTNVYILNLVDGTKYDDLSGGVGHIDGIKFKKPVD